MNWIPIVKPPLPDYEHFGKILKFENAMKTHCPKCHKHLATCGEPYLHAGEECEQCDPERKTVANKIYPETVLEKLWFAFIVWSVLLALFILIDWLSRHLRWVP